MGASKVLSPTPREHLQTCMGLVTGAGGCGSLAPPFLTVGIPHLGHQRPDIGWSLPPADLNLLHGGELAETQLGVYAQPPPGWCCCLCLPPPTPLTLRGLLQEAFWSCHPSCVQTSSPFTALPHQVQRPLGCPPRSPTVDGAQEGPRLRSLWDSGTGHGVGWSWKRLSQWRGG